MSLHIPRRGFSICNYTAYTAAQFFGRQLNSFASIKGVSELFWRQDKFKSFTNMYKVVGGILTVILGLIGILNLINVRNYC